MVLKLINDINKIIIVNIWHHQPMCTLSPKLASVQAVAEFVPCKTGCYWWMAKAEGRRSVASANGMAKISGFRKYQ